MAKRKQIRRKRNPESTVASDLIAGAVVGGIAIGISLAMGRKAGADLSAKSALQTALFFGVPAAIGHRLVRSHPNVGAAIGAAAPLLLIGLAEVTPS